MLMFFRKIVDGRKSDGGISYDKMTRQMRNRRQNRHVNVSFYGTDSSILVILEQLLL